MDYAQLVERAEQFDFVRNHSMATSLAKTLWPLVAKFKDEQSPAKSPMCSKAKTEHSKGFNDT